MMKTKDAEHAAIDGTAVQRVLVIQPNGFGDLLMAVSIFRLLRERLPSARITALVGGPDIGRLLQRAGLADNIALLPTGVSRLGKLAIFRSLRRQRFDVAIVATMFSWHHVLAARWFAGIPRVISDSGHVLTRLSATTIRRNPKSHRFLANGALLQPLLESLDEADIRACRSQIDVAPPSPKTSALLDRLRAPGGALYGLHLGSASQPIKRLPSELAAGTVRMLLRRQPGATVLYLQGPFDPPHDALPADLRQHTVAIAGLPVNDLLNVLRACSSVLTGDTGIAHLAAAAGTKAVVAAGPTDIARTRPWGERHAIVTTPTPPPCMPCYGTAVYDNDACPRGRMCLTGIRPGDLAAAMIGEAPRGDC